MLLLNYYNWHVMLKNILTIKIKRLYVFTIPRKIMFKILHEM